MNKQTQMKVYQYGEKLKKIFGLSIEPVLLCRRLRRLEAIAHRLAEDFCNGTMQEPEFSNKIKQVREKLRVMLELDRNKIPVFINGDPRGYALKIVDDYVREHKLDISTDMGGYGLLAPDLRGEQ